MPLVTMKTMAEMVPRATMVTKVLILTQTLSIVTIGANVNEAIVAD